jgi:hypothetical protein
MENKQLSSLRVFQCAQCAKPVNICTRCDRGNIYCQSLCSTLSRKMKHRAASKRYQNTPAGKRNHAQCQQRYRARLRARQSTQDNKVIDRGSSSKPPELLSPPLTKPTEGFQKTVRRCDFCRKTVSEFLRRGFLNTYRSPTRSTQGYQWLWGP